MKDTHERPICHRAEDLVSYLYGEASEADSSDFGNHLRQCDACRGEFAVFNQVHESIQLWRNEAFGELFNPAQVSSAAAIDSTQYLRHERKLSALAALREFFSVSPLWLRGVTAFAALVLCVLGVMMVARMSRQPVGIAKTEDRKYTQQELDVEVDKAVNRTRAQLANDQNQSVANANANEEPRPTEKRIQVAVNQTKNARLHGLNRQEREQLAADLRLTSPADEEELLPALPDQDKPNQ
ncbi:MAG TPA: hypothetical protein VE863_05950 [Pyrinomonadaceae bacterium]|jgi:anti-sigma factor RsiW|nr:hypothetical protein [Pyrinomonadaceae bacterium]